MKEGWVKKKLGEVCEMYQPKTISKKAMVVDGEYPVFGANGVIGRYDKYNHEEAQLLITCRGATCGSVNVSSPKSWINGNAMVIRPLDGVIDLKYLEYMFRGGINLSQTISGAAQPQITRKSLNPVEISYPKTLHEQQRIVSILDEVFVIIDKAKANAGHNLKNAKELFSCLLNNILTDENWEVRQLGEVCKKVEYGTSAKAHSMGELPVLRMGNIQDGRFRWNNLVYSNNKEDNKKYILKYNDVLFNRTNSPELVGKTAIYKGEMPAIFAGYLIRVHRKEDMLDADYLNYYLNSQMAFDYGKTVVISSVNQANINGTKLKTYPIPLPSLKEQQAIVRKLDTLRVEIESLKVAYQKKMNCLEELKKSILQKAFTGQLDTTIRYATTHYNLSESQN